MIKIFRRIKEKVASDCHSQEEDTAATGNLKQRLISALGFFAEDVYAICLNVKAAAGKFPASLSHHEAKEGGLYEHCLDVAFKAAKIMETKSSNKRDPLLAFMAGLFHDIGKVALYEVDANGYDYHPLIMPPPEKIRIVGTKNDQKNHAYISPLFLLPLLAEKVKIFSVSEILAIAETVRLHHAKISGKAFLAVLKEADEEAVADFEETVASASNTASTPQATEEADEATAEIQTIDIQNTPGRETKIDLTFWAGCFKEHAQTVYKSGFHYYLMQYEDTMILFLTSPKIVGEINELYRKKTGMMIHDSLFLEALQKNDYVAIFEPERNTPIVRVRMSVVNGKVTKERILKFVCLYAEKVLSQEEIARYATPSNIAIKKVYGQFRAKKS